MSGSYFSSDTIAAVATSLAGDAGMGVIRVSGPSALRAARTVCRGLEDPRPRYLHRIEVSDPATGTVVDDGLGVYFPENASFTGEEIIELQLHGGRFILKSTLNLLVGTGLCRLALPGEFSFRAVREGRMTLTGAEALGKIIGARSMFEVSAARRAIGSSRRAEFDAIAAKIRELTALCELSIDFIDQDVEVIESGRLCGELAGVIAAEDRLLEQMRMAQRVAEGARVTLAGATNAGKSTLFNALLAEDRSIVSSEAGTTRDIVTEDLQVGPYLVRIADTAGLRTGSGSVEQEGIDRAIERAEGSDVVVFVVDIAEDVSRDRSSLSRIAAEGDRKTILVLNKCDALEASLLSMTVAKFRDVLGVDVYPVSAITGEGVGALLDAVRQALDERVGTAIGGFLPTEFQLQMLLRSRASLSLAREIAERTALSQPELISAELASAVRALTDLVGETTPDTVLAKIFSDFCIGK